MYLKNLKVYMLSGLKIIFYYETLNEGFKKKPLEIFDGVLTTGHYFMLKNHKTNGFMVLDIDDNNINYDAAFAVTTSPLMTFSCPRSMFKFEKYDSIKHFNCLLESKPVDQVCFHDKI